MKAPASPLLAGSVAQRLRIVSGLVLFAFALFHFINHSLGLWSLEAMDGFQAWRTGVTRSIPGTIVLASALATHLTLNLIKIARRTTWRMPLWEAAQIALGLSIPLLLFPHAVPMRGHFDFEANPTRYSATLPDLWNNAALRQTILLLVVWVHGCIGLHFWLRLSPLYRRLAPVLLCVAVVIPSLALSGFMVGGRAAFARQAAVAAEKAVAPAAGYDGYDAAPVPKPFVAPTSAELERYGTWSAWALLTVAFLGFAARRGLYLTHPRLRVSYAGGPTVTSRAGPTLLEISRAAGVPHTSICGGRARCSTCRVKIEEAKQRQAEPNEAEAATLERIHADPDVRLACQFRPRGDISITRLVRPPEARRGPQLAGADVAGVEQTLAIMFLDIRGFTALSEARLPYDTVFLLNRFFAETGEAVNASGGWIDKYLGDGMMALFGLQQSVEDGCRAALTASMRIDEALDRLNHELEGELTAPLRIGIGLHAGPLVLGRIGHRASAATTVIGPAVNVASRLESMTKEQQVQLIASSELMRRAGMPDRTFRETEVTVRGTSEAMTVALIAHGRDLQPHLASIRQRRKAS